MQSVKNCGNITICEYSAVIALINLLEVSLMYTFVMILQVLCGLFVIAIVLFQSGKSAGLSGAIGGVADSFLAKNKAKSMDAKLARATKWVGAAFIVLTLALNML